MAMKRIPTNSQIQNTGHQFLRSAKVRGTTGQLCPRKRFAGPLGIRRRIDLPMSAAAKSSAKATRDRKAIASTSLRLDGCFRIPGRMSLFHAVGMLGHRYGCSEPSPAVYVALQDLTLVVAQHGVFAHATAHQHETESNEDSCHNVSVSVGALSLP